MRLAWMWTACMAVGIALLSASLVIQVSGAGAWGWIFAGPAVFIGLQAITVPIVVVGGLLERIGLVPRDARSQLHECVLVGILLLLAWWLLAWPIAPLTLGFFALMYAIRLVCRASWNPGAPGEVVR